MLHIIGALIVGLIAGAIAKLLMPGKDPGGCIITALLGVAGAYVGTFLGRALGWYGEDDYTGFIGAVIGALILLFLYRLVAGKRGS